MEAISWLKLFYGNIWVTKEAGSLVNKTGMARVGDFCDIIGKTSVYPKFGHLLDALMGRVSKVMMG